MEAQGVRALVLDPRRTGSTALRSAYHDELRARYAEISAVMDRLAEVPSWPAAEVDDRVELGPSWSTSSAR